MRLAKYRLHRHMDMQQTFYDLRQTISESGCAVHGSQTLLTSAAVALSAHGLLATAAGWEGTQLPRTAGRPANKSARQPDRYRAR